MTPQGAKTTKDMLLVISRVPPQGAYFLGNLPYGDVVEKYTNYDESFFAGTAVEIKVDFAATSTYLIANSVVLGPWYNYATWST